MPQTIQFANGNKTEYMYDAAGIKQSARWSYSTTEANIQLGDVANENNSIGTTSTTDYCGAYVYEQGKLTRILTPEGYVSARGAISSNTIAYWQHVYLLKDHLGNTRKIMLSNYLSSTSVALTERPQAIDYYPFGMEITKVDNADSERYYSYMGGGAIPYLYNGKEMDRMHGLNSYDYGARWRDGVIPAWPAVDPLAEKYYSFSPYVYCGNNPVSRIDPDGMDWVITTSKDKDGNLIYHITVNAVLYNNSSTNYTEKQMNQLQDQIKNECMSVFNISGVDFKMNLSVANSVNDIKSTDHVFQIVDQNVEGGYVAHADTNRDTGKVGSLNIQLGTNWTNSVLGITNDKRYNIRTAAHELGHTGGLLDVNLHSQGVTDIKHNLMAQSAFLDEYKIKFGDARQVTSSQIGLIYSNLHNGVINNVAPPVITTYTLQRTNTPGTPSLSLIPGYNIVVSSKSLYIDNRLRR